MNSYSTYGVRRIDCQSAAPPLNARVAESLELKNATKDGCTIGDTDSHAFHFTNGTTNFLKDLLPVTLV